MRLLALLALLAPALSAAQSTGTLVGRVVDEAGEGLPGASVAIERTTLGATTDMEGHYRIIGIPTGVYTVTATFVGFEPREVSRVHITTGPAREVTFSLEGVFWQGCGVIPYCPPLLSSDPFGSRLLPAERSLCGQAGLLDLPVGR